MPTTGEALRLGYQAQALTLGATATLIAVGAPDPLVYAAAVLAASAVTMTRPAQAALVPALVDDDDELTAINALAGWVESSSLLTGAAIAGPVMMFAGPDIVIGCFALLVTISALLVAPVRPRHERFDCATPAAQEHFDARAGVDALREDHGLAAVVGVLGAEYFVIGALDVLLVVLAIDVLGLGSSGAGYLNAAFGAGGVLGSVVAVSLIGRPRLAGPLIGASIGWGALLAALGAWPTGLSAFLLLIAAGATRTVVDVSGVTMFGLALGSALVPLMVALGGSGFALVATAAFLVCVTLAAAAALRSVDHALPLPVALPRRRTKQRGDVVGDRVRVA